MKKRTLAALFAASMISGATAMSAAPSDKVAIVDAMIFDGTGAAPYKATVLIENGRIAAVGAGLPIPAGAAVMQAKGRALLPGFFDVHSHWTAGGTPATTPQIATAYVEAGVTTVNDFGQPPESYGPRREWLGSLVSPHVLFAARVASPGGHGATWGDENTTALVSTPEMGRAAIARLVPYKPDLIKIFNDGWRYGAMPDNTSMNEDAVAAVAEAAHRQGWPVLTHTVTVERGMEASRAGVDSLAHGMQNRPVTAEEIAQIKKTGMAMAPTLAVYDPYKTGAPEGGENQASKALSIKRFGYALQNVKALHDAGIPIGLGTDAGMPRTPHGVSSLHEMELLVQAGLTPKDALLAGTSVSARIMRLDGDRGTIAVGKRADLVLIDGKPWANISDVRKIAQVYIDGRLVSGEGAPPLPAGNMTTRLPSVAVGPLVDNFERADGRSALDTLRIETPDDGIDRSNEITQIVPRDDGHALALVGRFATRDDAYVGTAIPLTRGSVRPANLTRYKGIRLDVRGQGNFLLTLNGLDGRWSAPVVVGTDWASIDIPFTMLKPNAGRGGTPAKWSGTDLIQVEIGATGKAAARLWLQADNISFY